MRNWSRSPDRCVTPRETGRLTVYRKLTSASISKFNKNVNFMSMFLEGIEAETSGLTPGAGGRSLGGRPILDPGSVSDACGRLTAMCCKYRRI
jgi:hypothetical protein